MNFADPHDADNVYAWCIDTGIPEVVCDNVNAADGPAFTDFLRSLNSGACFSGQCDWRLPTRIELVTIVVPTIPAGFSCSVTSCIDPIFGPTQVNFYWSAAATADQNVAWTVSFDNSFNYRFGENVAFSVRAVRGGL